MTRNRVNRSHGRVESIEQPAVGIVARKRSAEAFVRTVLRAKERDYHVFVTHPGARDLEAVRFAEQLDVEVIDPPESKRDPDSLTDLLVTIARARSFPGIIIQNADYERIDYESSEARLDDGTFAVEAVSESNPPLPLEPTVLVGIPAYGEAETIGEVVHKGREYADTVLVVDDGSPDDTAEVARDAGATVVEHTMNEGYGAALKTIFEEAHDSGAEHLVVLDADGQHDPTDVRKLVDEQKRTDADIVIGSRFERDSGTDLPLYRWFGLKVINLITNLSLGRTRSWIQDTQSGFRAYDRRAIELLAETDDISDDMDASMDILYHACQNGCDIEEVETTIDYDVDNASSYNPVFHGLILVDNILRIIERDHPILLLGFPGLFMTLAGVGFGYWAVLTFVQAGSFSFGVALLATFCTLIGLFTSFTSIILHSLNSHLKNVF